MSACEKVVMAQAQLIIGELKKNAVTHVVGLPDNSSAKLFDLLAQDQDLRVASVTREGEAFALAAGLWMGGKKPVVLIQNTGFSESGDGFRGTITRMRVPLVCMITFRGYAKMIAAGLGSAGAALDAETLARPQLDSAALITEPTLKAWGLPFAYLHTDEDVPLLSEAFRKVDACQRPFAILMTRDLV
jgi:sulfopyruvate decarboxylase TPP-binding subunit